MQFVLKNGEYKKILELCEKFAGTVEPGFRFVRLHYFKGLRFFVSDGCGKLELAVNKEVSPFSGTYILPIDQVRVLKERKSKEENIQFSLGDKKLVISANGDRLIIENSKIEERPRMERKFEALFKMELSEFRRKLNFASSINVEGEMVTIFGGGNETAMVSTSSNMTVIAFLKTESKRNFQVSLPYVTVRHLFKALETLKNVEIVFGDGINDVGLKAGPLLFSFCNDRTPVYEERIFSLKKNTYKETPIDRNLLLTGLKKMARLVKKGFSVLLISKAETLKLLVKTGNFKYETTLAISEFPEFFAKIDPHRLRSAVSRCSSKKLFIAIHGKELLISDRLKEYMVSIPITL
ncbi:MULTISPECIES: hypothetical protein [Kosmotoga]|uniref:Uncharacterized protein n=1 Tax=Kosmotoga olearia (strain ATCC BAA-1733 / DSM 21960 / TBF 19.5.1) TaxID=521045 RepID=C5CGL6_KOSOT|nr:MULTISPECIES: hypothetical protein [Kosmotoga]ACR79598.1 hypothetical protein Kole_0889 [Kosmotoga olearia TBF 19.5.1]MDI3523848.1 hypothetical protein [Kosmotoga sp.]MDK2953134.1 hypothetical protein [Kosmotoga sp.]OAA22147.1 hypothetical protein DU53_04695 [Kosmotoga sp. DU53]